ncbi:MAG: hypothetical protein GTO22_11700, partial [Gemmatimonadales bacterium]|nr:hypothetical protein [Gemmatimonadales bacterium]
IPINNIGDFTPNLDPDNEPALNTSSGADYLTWALSRDLVGPVDRTGVFVNGLAGGERPVTGQNELFYDGDVGEGTFAAGSLYVAGEVITLSDGSTVTVDDVSGGAVIEFTVDGTNSTGGLSGDTLTQSSTTGSGAGFSLTLGIVNSTQVDDLNQDGILDTPIDADGNGIFDGLDLDGDGEIDLYHYLAGGLFDPFNTSDDEVNNFEGEGIGADGDGDDPGYINADDPGGYFRFYDAFSLTNSITTPVEGQDQNRYDGGAGEGTFTGGTNYEPGDTLTLSDGSTVTVDEVVSGAVVEFRVTDSASSSGAIAGDTLTATGGGSGFTLTLGADNVGGTNTGYNQGDLQEDVPLVPEFTIVFYAQVEIDYHSEIVVDGDPSPADTAVDLTDELGNYNYLSFTNILEFEGDLTGPLGVS